MFLGELRRRKILQVAAVYAVVAWLLIQVVATIEEPLRLPDWFDTVVIVLLAVGFPITLIISWAFNLTAEGLVRDEGGAAPSPGRMIEFVLAGLLVVAVAWLFYQVQFRPEEGTAAAGVHEPPGVLSSVAVLPFRDLSPTGDQDYFVVGMADEIISRLGRIADIRVPALTSSLVFQNEREDIRRIGEQLGVETVLEGSVRKSGDDLRITATLIRVADGFTIWTGNYNRQLVDVFAVQDEVALAVVDALQVQLGPDRDSGNRPTNSLAAYDSYLLGQRAAFSRTEASLREAIGHFKSATQLDPDYADAYARLAWAYWLLVEYEFADTSEILPLIAEAAEKAFVLDPGSEAALTAMSLLRSYQLQWRESILFARAAVSSNPGSAEAHLYLAVILERGRHTVEAIAEYRSSLSLDPLDPNVNRLLGRALADDGDYDEAIPLLEKSLELNSANPDIHKGLAEAYSNAGREAEAVKTFLAWPGLPDEIAEAERIAPDGTLRALYSKVLELEVRRSGSPCTDESDTAANYYYFLDELDSVFECLNQRIDARLPIFGFWHVRLAVDPRYDRLAERLNLSEAQ